jgi:23S rRNA (adenine2503-C2)-methyltransferase
MNGSGKRDIRSLLLADIEEFFKSNNLKTFHGKQVYNWLWKRSCRAFNEMSDLSKSTRQLLEDNFDFRVAGIAGEQISSDKTIKTSFWLHDGVLVEGVLIPSSGRTTACISSQAGCPLACTFCATGQLGFTRNLDFTEIFDQVTQLNLQSEKYHKTPLSNIVYMGMGEPLLNYDAVVRSIEKITDPDGLGISPQRITLSSVGIPDMIRRLADDRVKCHFALSLHAADNLKRSKIVPLNRKYPVEELTKALLYYHQETKKRFTIEYVLFRNFNDSTADAHNLAVFCKSFPVKINLIEYNPVENTGYEKSGPVKMQAFKECLEKKNLVVNVRKSRGEDIDAACGQLALKLKNLGKNHEQ